MSLRSRFVFWFALAALVSIGATAFLAFSAVSSAYQSEFDRRLESAHRDAQREFDAMRTRVEVAVAGLATRQSPLVGGVLLELEKQTELSPEQRRTLGQLAPQTMKALGLDTLLLVAGDGTVLASPHDPSRLDEKIERSPRSRAHVAWEPVVSGGQVVKLLTVQAHKTITDRGQTVTVCGGKELGPDFLAPLRRDGVEARLLDANGKVLAQTTRAWGPFEGAPQQPLLITDAKDRPIAQVVVAVSDAQLRQQLGELALRTAGLAAVALAAAAVLGWIIARRIARGLDALVAGAQAVSRGELEHRVAVKGKDEISEVASAFNGMTEELTESRERLQQAERLAAWQEIAQRLAHEIKNPLTPIQMSVETMRKTHAAKHAAFEEIFTESTGTILEEVQRLKRIVSEFSQFARMPTAHKRALDLNEVVASAVGLYRGAAPVTSELDPALPEIQADRDQLTQVVLNLLENARDAVAEKGTIVVRTRVRKGAVELEVEDDGPGFDAAIRDKLFTPYFTTKANGNGLGLSIVWRIVVDHGGRIAASSTPGAGARFTILLPVGAALVGSFAGT
jgi:signal transduction histidine kinase